MSNDFQLPPEAKAYQAFLNWLEEAKKVWILFEQEGVQVPESLRRVMDNNNSDGGQTRPMALRPPEHPSMPSEAKSDWYWIKANEAVLMTVVLAIIKQEKIISTKDLITKVKKILPSQNEGSIYNVGANREGKDISRAEDGWSLKEGIDAPILYEGYIWAPKRLLQKQDLAAFRRMAVRHLLASSSDGLQIMQVYRQLDSVNWLKTPLSKDLIKADLFAMKEDKRVKQQGNSKKWILIGEK
ncbi:MAG: hypothetical protein Q7T03_05680 [Deltaproteobacteria bacterium]|nr:hypothetical protein [Deltaproteobacteria bacterium]